VTVAGDPTPSQTVGPFFGFALPFADDAQAVDPRTPGAARIEGQVLDGAGKPVPDALVEIWQADQFARCRTDPEGAFHFVVVKPGGIPGPCGRAQAPHLNVTVFARGLLRHLVTRLYFPEERAANAADPVLQLITEAQARSTLVATEDCGVLRFDIHLQGDRETVFFAI
jgi:protocatechuate 3,4-dioxygenase, alpha subunit